MSTLQTSSLKCQKNGKPIGVMLKNYEIYTKNWQKQQGFDGNFVKIPDDKRNTIC